MPSAPGEFSATPGDPSQPFPGTATAPAKGPEPSGDGHRPTSFDPEQLGFTPRRAVPWLSPVLLSGTAVRVLLAELFGAYLDKRELQDSQPSEISVEQPERRDR